MTRRYLNHWHYLLIRSLTKKTVLSKYLLSVLLILVALLLRLLAAPILGASAPLLPFLIPIILASWYGGLGPGIIATILGATLATYFFIEPAGFVGLISVSEGIAITLFLIEGFIVSALNQAVQDINMRQKNLLESITDAFFTLDTHWRFRYINKHALRYLQGYDRSSLINHNIWDLFPDAKKTLSYKKYREAIRTQKVLHYEEYLPGLNKWLDFHIYPSKQGLSIYFTDITKRKLDEQKLRESENRFKELADHAPVLIWMAGVDKLRYYFNKSWLNFTGRKISQEVGNGWQELVHPDDLDNVLDVYNSAFDARIDYQMEYRLRRHDGEYRWMLVTGVPRFTRFKNFLGYLGTCIDITERKQLEESKDNFISIASHELKTPLTTLSAYSQLLTSKVSKDKNSEIYNYITKINNQVEKISDLVTDLLDVSRINEGKLRYDKEVFNLVELIEEIVADIQSTSPQHKIILKVKYNAKVLGDSNRIAQVLVNLLTNAIKYSPKAHKIVVTVEKTKRAKNSITVGVQDFGIGIARSEHEKIFERFYRADDVQKKTISGFGLGLHITSEIVKRHGGKIWVKSIKDKGSTFFFTLPTE